MAGWLLVGGLIVDLDMLAFSNIHPTNERVVAAAEDYATAFIRSLTAVTASIPA